MPASLTDELADASAEFFALPMADKLEIAMERGGRAWRGFFPVGAELPFFLDPGFAAEVPPLPDRAAAGHDGTRRWDGQDLLPR